MPLDMKRGGSVTEAQTIEAGVSHTGNVLFVTSEVAGLLKAGGLGEISAFLPRMLRQLGLDTRILMPGYAPALTQAEEVKIIAELPGLHAIPAARLAELRMDDGSVIYAVVCPELYERDGSPYGDAQGREFADNDLRFARLSLAAAQIAAGLPTLGWEPDVVHTNDWPTALAPAYMRWHGCAKPSILTVHNLAYQGVYDRSRLSALGIPDAAFQTNGVEFHGKLSFLKAGLVYTSHVTTVSPTYAKEILTPDLGCGLDGLLRERAAQGQLTGILNGIDDSYDPRFDPHLEHHFGCGDLSGKRSNALDMRQIFGLSDSSGPLFALISRLVHQKGVDLVVEAARAILDEGGQVIATGQGEPHLEQAMKALAESHPGSVGVHIGFEETLARRMYAASDFLLMPSRFEPCGLSQMYAQRFGSLPIAHKTGGLVDTIQDDVTGFLFDNASANSFDTAIRRACTVFRSGKALDRMKSAAMRRPSGWSQAAADYHGVYNQAMLAPQYS